jgi:hypothetical protein
LRTSELTIQLICPEDPSSRIMSPFVGAKMNGVKEVGLNIDWLIGRAKG